MDLLKVSEDLDQVRNAEVLSRIGKEIEVNNKRKEATIYWDIMRLGTASYDS